MRILLWILIFFYPAGPHILRENRQKMKDNYTPIILLLHALNFLRSNQHFFAIKLIQHTAKTRST